MRSIRPFLLSLAVLVAPAVPAVAGGTLPCIPLLDGRCELWATVHDAGATHASQSVLLTSRDGERVFSAGTIEGPDGFRALVDGHDAVSGERRWSASAGRPGDAYATAAALAVSLDGRTLYMAGSTCAVLTDGSTCDLLVEAYDAATGARRWSVIADGGGNGLDSAQSVAVNAEGRVLIAGQAFRTETDEDYLLAAYDPDTGEPLWSTTYDGPAHGFDRGAELALDGDVAVVTGRSAGSADNDIATAAFRASGEDAGELLWARRIEGSGPDDATGIDAAAGRVVIAGSGARVPAPVPLVAAYDLETGKELWVARYDDPGIGVGDLFDVAITRDGRSALAAGYTARSDGKGPTTLAYDVTTGQRRWVQNLQEGLGYAVAISPNGERAYVTGSTYERRGTQHRTLSYDLATGAERWRGLYEESAPPAGIRSTVLFPTAISISPDGTHLYVAGQHVALGESASDALVLAYQA